VKTYALTIGLVIRQGDRTWRLQSHLQDDTLVFIDQVTGTPHTLTPATLQRDVLAKKFEIVSADFASSCADAVVTAPLVKTVDDLPPHQAWEVKRRYRYVIHLKKKGLRRGMREHIQAAIKNLHGALPARHTDEATELDPKVPSASTAMEWMRRWDDSGGNLLSLLTRHAVRRSSKRLDPEVVRIGREMVRDFYCTRQRRTIEATRVQINTALCSQAARVGTEPKTISISSLRRLVQEISPYERDESRYGAAYARHKWRFSLRGIGAERPLQRYEIDHTVLDIVVLSDTTGMPLGRPVITIAVDAYSGYVTGFFISFWGTGLANSLAALKVAISPKGEYCLNQGLSKRWLPLGIPSLMVVDNGLEFHSPQFHSIAQHLNMDLRFCAVRQPWLKPFVERELGNLCGYLPVEGRVEKKLDNYLPEKPERTASITFSALCAGILKAIVEIHPFEVGERNLWLPYDRFGEGMAKLLPPSLPTSTSELDLIVAVSKELTVGNEGVVSNYIRFNSIELQSLRRQIGTTFKARVKFNPEDLNAVHVQDPRTKGWLPVPSCMPEYTSGLSVVQHKAIRARLRADLERRQVPEYLMRAKAELADLWNSRAVIGKRLQGAQLRAMSGLTSSHALLGATRPAVTDARKSAADPVQLLTKSELRPPAEEIPEFDAFAMV